MARAATRFLVLGSEGILGRAVMAEIPDATPVPRRGPGGVDVRNTDALLAILDQASPDVVVNCVGLTKPHPDLAYVQAAIEVNALLPHRLADLGETLDFHLIHASTDCVFRGDRGNYTESVQPDEQDLHGRTKALGEVVDRPNTVTLRTSFIGWDPVRGRHLLEWFVREVRAGRRVGGYTRAIWSGVPAPFLAQLIHKLPADWTPGLFNVASEPISKYDLLREVAAALDLDADIVPDPSFACDRSLCGDKFIKTYKFPIPPHRDLVRSLV